MTLRVVIRHEHKSSWEGRAPLTPQDVATVTGKGNHLYVERSDHRVFSDEEYKAVGAELVDSHAGFDVVLGIKEPAIDSIEKGSVHVAFSHTIKGQDYNMPLLQRFLDQGATLIDYELMTDEKGVRTVAFGRYAGIAGAVDTLMIAGRKFANTGHKSRLESVKQTYHYETIDAMHTALQELGPISDEDEVRVVVVGDGKVGRGAVEVLEWLGLKEISRGELLADPAPEGSWYCVLKTEDVVKAKDGSPFDREHYRAEGKDAYDSDFEKYLGRFNILLQTPYWDDDYPRQLPRELMIRRADDLPEVIGDISCDIEGSLECTVKASLIDEPAFTYDPETHEIVDGIHHHGPSVMSIDHLPCELARDASAHFSENLSRHMDELMTMDLSKDLDSCGLDRELKDATIVYKGELTPRFQYLKDYL